MGRPSKIDLALRDLVGCSLLAYRRAFCGEKIGRGVYRDVYICKVDPHFVVKIERDMSEGYFTNVMEWRNWIDNKDWKQLSNWLAPCEAITESGQLLIQRRVQQYKSRPFPEKIPAIFTDLKRQNFGWIGQRFVCCDYPLFLIRGFYWKKAKWWDHDVQP